VFFQAGEGDGDVAYIEILAFALLGGGELIADGCAGFVGGWVEA